MFCYMAALSRECCKAKVDSTCNAQGARMLEGGGGKSLLCADSSSVSVSATDLVSRVHSEETSTRAMHKIQCYQMFVWHVSNCTIQLQVQRQTKQTPVSLPWSPTCDSPVRRFTNRSLASSFREAFSGALGAGLEGMDSETADSPVRKIGKATNSSNATSETSVPTRTCPEQTWA